MNNTPLVDGVGIGGGGGGGGELGEGGASCLCLRSLKSLLLLLPASLVKMRATWAWEREDKVDILSKFTGWIPRNNRIHSK